MNYRVLARKYRPQTFDEIIGQAHVATTLTNALRSGKIAHAYLFSGPRGVGKTTTARILAKALNCVKGPTPIPCNACDACQRVALGQEMMDVIEIDAASNRGIEEIRELRENVVYAPAHSRYKVYIIDEAHQITHDAFSAFLKTLEEPPAHAVFILATTEHQKIPSTILSRCQLFRFKRIAADEITSQLERILIQEKVKVERPALARLARAAGGSVRDALGLLDQALAYVGSDPTATSSGGLTPLTVTPLTVQQVELLLGFLPDEFLQGFAGALMEKQPSNVLNWVKRLAEEGWDLPQFVRDFREFLRDALVNQLASGAQPAALALAGGTVSLAELLQMIKVMGHAQDDMRWNDNPRLVLELYGLRLTQPFVDAGALLRRIEGLERGDGGTEGRRNDEKQIADPPTPRATPASMRGTGLLDEKQGGARPADPISSTNSDAASQWKQLLAELWKRPAVGSQMERARLQSASEKEWVIAFPDKYGMDVALRSQTLIQEALAKIVSHPMGVRFVQSASTRREEVEETVVTPTREERGDDRQPVVLKDEGVQKVLQTFRGRIRAQEE